MSAGWALTSHCCRLCLGRILEANGSVMCADCGAEACGRPESLCACGVMSEAKRRLFRCTRNPSPSPASPALIVVTRVDMAF